MIYDLHCHSNCSDGLLAVDALIDLAIQNNVGALSITDHDSVLAYSQIKEQQTKEQQAKESKQRNSEEAPSKIKIIPGIEFSSSWNGVGVHILGLNINPECPSITDGSKQQQQARKTRAEKISEKLAKAGLKDALEGAQKHVQHGEISRPHFAKYMVEAGFSKNIEQAFKKYLDSGKMGDIKQGWADLKTVTSWIKESGGVAVLAHPHKYKLTRTKLVALVDAFQAIGGEGMEVLSGAEDKNITANLVQICQQKNLLASIGSDFHAPSAWSRLGMHQTLPAHCKPVWSVF